MLSQWDFNVTVGHCFYLFNWKCLLYVIQCTLVPPLHTWGWLRNHYKRKKGQSVVLWWRLVCATSGTHSIKISWGFWSDTVPSQFVLKMEFLKNTIHFFICQFLIMSNKIMSPKTSSANILVTVVIRLQPNLHTNKHSLLKPSHPYSLLVAVFVPLHIYEYLNIFFIRLCLWASHVKMRTLTGGNTSLALHV